MIYSKKDISKVYTDIVKANLEYGYINIRSMGGSQGEDSRIDIDLGGGRVRRILIDSSFDLYLGELIFIKVIDFMDDCSTIYWNDRGDLIQSFYFIPIKGGSSYYMADCSELVQIMAKMKVRSKTKNEATDWTKLDSKYYPIFKRVIQSFDIAGWKRFDIKSVSIRTYNGKRYYIVRKANGDSFRLQRHGTKFYLD